MKIEPIDTRHNMDQVCIKNCDQECFDADMLSVIKKGFERHGLSARVYSGDMPSDCLYHLTYNCKRAWDLAMYMHHAELRLFRDENQIGYAEFHLKGEGGFAFAKGRKRRAAVALANSSINFTVSKSALFCSL